MQSLRRSLAGAWWPSAGYTGPLMRDYSAFSRNGTTVGAWSAKYGRITPEANGTTNAITLPGAIAVVAGDFTVSLWFYLAAFNGGFCTLFDKGGSGSTYEMSVFFNTSGDVSYSGFGRATSSSVRTLGITTGAWQHIAVTRAGSTVTYYRNGRATSTDTNSGVLTSTNAWALGTNPSLGGTNPTGAYDDVRAWSRCLTQSEIVTLATRPGIGLLPPLNRPEALPRKFWVNVGGTWRNADSYVNVGGVWKLAVPSINVGGTWK